MLLIHQSDCAAQQNIRFMVAVLGIHQLPYNIFFPNQSSFMLVLCLTFRDADYILAFFISGSPLTAPNQHPNST